MIKYINTKSFKNVYLNISGLGNPVMIYRDWFLLWMAMTNVPFKKIVFNKYKIIWEYNLTCHHKCPISNPDKPSIFKNFLLKSSSIQSSTSHAEETSVYANATKTCNRGKCCYNQHPGLRVPFEKEFIGKTTVGTSSRYVTSLSVREVLPCFSSLNSLWLVWL